MDFSSPATTESMAQFRNKIRKIYAKLSPFIRLIKLIKNLFIKILIKKWSVTRISIRILKI